ncbi:carotenoid oxygenase family protein [Asticcacaulis sp. DXS10W]|uniref:Dioxygenase n=1 Tax=Asticcacaulis currens TaxID=2984210 RepID=A0ABT5IDV2_9CAUL|nr:carotenoid oxygenase family protein [Asticcacaulis currens]MDC7694381.1 carotenoid oxygenase family protein [Asticcacaulis currens]
MRRREFLAATGAVLASGTPLYGQTPDDTLTQFKQAYANAPWLAGFVSATDDRPYRFLETEGKWPASLSGVFYRNGPARHELGGQRYHHFFDSDGMVHRYAIKDGKIRYNARFVRTQKYKEETAAGRLLYDTAGTLTGGPGVVKSPDSVNAANINLLAAGRELWALWEAGSPYALDPETLETQGVVSLSPELAGAPFSAHPRHGADGRIWNFGVFGNRMALYRLTASARLEAFKVIEIDPVGMVHDFFLTEKSMVIVLPSSDLTADGESYFGSIRHRPDKAMQVLIVDRETLNVVRRSELPSGFWFHGGNAWEGRDGILHFDINLLPDARALQSFRDVMRGRRIVNPWDIGTTTRFSLHANGRFESASIPGEAEFPRIDPRVSSRQYRFVFTAERSNAISHWFDAVRRVDLTTGAVDRYGYGSDYLVEEHVFIPRSGSTREGDGWLLGTALHWPTRRTCLSLFDAANISNGPAACAWLPVAAPLGLHGQFIPTSI